MTILAAQTEAIDMVALLQLLATIGLAILASYFVFFKRGEQSKDKIHDQDLVILKQELEGKIHKERGSREKLEIEIGSKQNAINKDLKDLITAVHDGQVKSDERQVKSEERWASFISYQQRWEDSTSDKIQDTMLNVSKMTGKLTVMETKIETETKNIRTMVERFINDSRKKSEETAE